MKVKIIPSKASGKVFAPPSKSLAHRALICGALAGGSVVKNVSQSKDIAATLSCLESLGTNFSSNGNEIELCKLDFSAINDNTELFCDESGSTLRFLIPLCLLTGKRVVLKGSKRLFERPLGIYEDICREQGILFEKGEDSLTVCGKLKSGNFKIRGDISSQFISGLLFALPLLDGLSIIEIIGELESASYIELTLNVLSYFGIKITHAGNRFIIFGNQSYQNREYFVEGDCSNAAFLDALNFVGGDVEVCGVSPETLQGDRVYADIFKGMKEGINEFDLSDCPDLAPILFAMASLVGNVRFNGTSRLRIKESDRGVAMQTELLKFGIPVEVGENHVLIGSATLVPPSEPLFGHNDHRIVMALSVLLTLTGGVIEGAEAVSKSYPDFFDVLKNLNVGIEINEN